MGSTAPEAADETKKKPGPAPGEGGAPKKPESERRKKQLGFRVTEAEAERIEQAAEERGIKKAEMFRRAVFAYLDE